MIDDRPEIKLAAMVEMLSTKELKYRECEDKFDSACEAQFKEVILAQLDLARTMIECDVKSFIYKECVFKLISNRFVSASEVDLAIETVPGTLRFQSFTLPMPDDPGDF